MAHTTELQTAGIREIAPVAMTGIGCRVSANAGKVELLAPSYTASGHENRHSHFGKPSGGPELLQDSEIPLLG